MHINTHTHTHVPLCSTFTANGSILFMCSASFIHLGDTRIFYDVAISVALSVFAQEELPWRL